MLAVQDLQLRRVPDRLPAGSLRTQPGDRLWQQLPHLRLAQVLLQLIH